MHSGGTADLRRRGARPWRRLVAFVVLVASVVCTTAAFGANAGVKSQKLTSITFRTGIETDAWDAPFVVALKKGFYKQAGLNVKIAGGLGSFSNVQLAAQGQADIVHAASGPMILAAAKGANVKMIGSFVQEGGSGIATIPSITSQQDMVGKTFFGLSFDYTTVLLPTYEKIVGISGIKSITSNSSSTIQPLLDGSADMIAATGWAEVPELKSLGFKFNYFSYAKVGFNMIGPGLVVNGSWLKSHMAAAKAFALASARGWQYALSHQAEAVAIMHNAYPQVNVKFTKAILKNYPGYNHTPASKHDPLGYMENSDWVSTIGVLEKAGLLTASSAPSASSLYVNLVPKNSPYK